MNALVLGAGTMGNAHSAAYAKMEGVRLCGIVDVNEEKAKQLADRYGTQAFTSYQEAKQQIAAIDVVSVCLPTPLHKEMVMQVAEDKSHIVCEKPLARHLDDAREMIQYCQQQGVRLFVGHVVRFFPEYVQAKQVLDTEKIGQPVIARTTRGGAFPRASNDWYANFIKSGGVILDTVIHDFDFLRWCFGDVERVYAKTSRGRTAGSIEYALITLRFENGVIAHVEGTWAHQTFHTKLEIAGKDGIIQHDSSAVNPVVLEKKAQANEAAGVAVPSSPSKDNPYFLEIEHFIECIKEDKEPIVTAEDAYKAMEIALAALESIETRKPVYLTHSTDLEGVR
ncbi:Gfo/Idh/MocA family protein [Gracilibacillus alcaliphilus]|uniref:Gfo/Idh/MocA family protein n=1 Tax=Gracilibacillus alcaliphilus TaxID=1401441 RepID=UPI00195B0288|nr:Gfo/Idh/MocA family oxidoreductase [Gracilibacillus alcaliphilus]MBM7677469.1 putative dehydrogenase [Gracilibacillus alcaliphilus]